MEPLSYIEQHELDYSKCERWKDNFNFELNDPRWDGGNDWEEGTWYEIITDGFPPESPPDDVRVWGYWQSLPILDPDEPTRYKVEELVDEGVRGPYDWPWILWNYEEKICQRVTHWCVIRNPAPPSGVRGAENDAKKG